MATVTAPDVLDRLFDPLSQCLTAESAKRLLKLKADRQLKARAEYLAERCTAGKLTSEEQSEYDSYVNFSTFIALLKSKARLHLSQALDA